MSGNSVTPNISLRERFLDSGAGQERLRRWLVLSLILHGTFILGLFLMPYWPVRQVLPPPVYTVDLVGGERIGGTNLGSEFASKPTPKKTSPVAEPVPPPPPPAPKPQKEIKVEPPPPAPVVKKQAKKEPVEKPNKTVKAKVDNKAAAAEKVPTKSLEKKEIAKKETASTAPNGSTTEAKTDNTSLDRVRERLIQSAVERVKSRTDPTQKTSNSEVFSAGMGQGIGSASIGPGGPGGGGVAKGIAFIAYQNQMLGTIKANWAWVGQNNNLSVVVQFNIRENGDIIGLKVVQPSGDPSYDESVLRAVRKSSPLPAPPESHRRDFSEIKITFRPRDLGA